MASSGPGGADEPQKPQKPPKPKPKPKPTGLTPEQKQNVWQKVFDGCLKRKEQERKETKRAQELELSRHFTVACVIGGVVGAIEGGLEFGPLGVPLGFHFGCALGVGEVLVIPILAVPETRVIEEEKAQGDCKKEADRIVSKL